MEDEIKEAFPNLGKLKIVCRNGSPNNLQDLEIVNPQDSKSIIILSDDFNKSDAQIIKTILAITKSPNRRIDPYHIKTELNNERNNKFNIKESFDVNNYVDICIHMHVICRCRCDSRALCLYTCAIWPCTLSAMSLPPSYAWRGLCCEKAGNLRT
jgi:hypothetical protein